MTHVSYTHTQWLGTVFFQTAWTGDVIVCIEQTQCQAQSNSEGGVKHCHVRAVFSVYTHTHTHLYIPMMTKQFGELIESVRIKYALMLIYMVIRTALLCWEDTGLINRMRPCHLNVSRSTIIAHIEWRHETSPESSSTIIAHILSLT